MRTLLWLVVGWLSIAFWTALGSRLSVGHVIPDMAVIMMVFLALRRDAVTLVVVAAVLGYLVGRQALAPPGLHEFALSITTIAVYVLAGHLQASGGIFFAFVVSLTTMAYHLLLFLLLLWSGGQAGFSSWENALLLPQAAITGIVARLAYPIMLAIDRHIAQERREDLSWR